jgi:HTH-type transcriptional regulator, sugar sensing transcriptional regulator
MIVEKDFLAKLKNFGLNTYEAKLWTALLSRGVSTAGELSDIANVPRSRTYDVLESLEKKGFIIMKLGKPIKYMAVDPTEVVSRVQKTIRQDADVQLKLIEELKGSEVLNELSLLHSNGIEALTPSDMSGSFKGRESVYDHIDTMIKSAEESIVFFTTEQGFMREMPFFKRSLEKAAARGVSIKIATKLTKTSKNDELIKAVGSLAEIRDIDSIKSRFIIVDGKEVLFMLMNDEDVHPTYDIGIWVNTCFFAEALEQMFDLAWKDMKVIVKK